MAFRDSSTPFVRTLYRFSNGFFFKPGIYLYSRACPSNKGHGIFIERLNGTIRETTGRKKVDYTELGKRVIYKEVHSKRNEDRRIQRQDLIVERRKG